MAIAGSSQSKWHMRYGPWAVVTGATDGIGHAIALNCAARGLNLVLVARRGDMLEAMAQTLAARHGIKTLVIAADLGTAEGVEAVLAQTAGLDCGLLVCAAGFGTAGAFLDLDAASESNMIDVNCRAVYLLSRELAARMARSGHGGIVLFSSIVAFQGSAFAANYAATKAYVQVLGEGLQTELAPLGVDVLVVAPGPVDTGFAKRADMRMGQAAKPEAVALTALDKLGRVGLVRPGFLSKLLGYSLATLPRFARRRIMSGIMKGMTEHQRHGIARSGGQS